MYLASLGSSVNNIVRPRQRSGPHHSPSPDYVKNDKDLSSLTALTKSFMAGPMPPKPSSSGFYGDGASIQTTATYAGS